MKTAIDPSQAPKLCALLDQARQCQNLPSDYALAKKLGMNTSVLSNWRHGRKYPGLLETFALAGLAGRAADQVLAELELERASRAGRTVQVMEWRNTLDRLTAGALAVFLSAVAGLSFTPDASAMARTLAPNTAGSPHGTPSTTGATVYTSYPIQACLRQLVAAQDHPRQHRFWPPRRPTPGLHAVCPCDSTPSPHSYAHMFIRTTDEPEGQAPALQ